MSDIKLYQGSLLDVLDDFEENSIDTCITDPPYHLKSITKRFGKKGSAPANYGKDGAFSRVGSGFMGEEWDGGDISFDPETWKKVYRVLKPGAYLLAFGGTRTFHRIAVAIEDAGFEIKDCLMWLYGTGFPKGYNVSLGYEKQDNPEQAEKWQGWNTALKPAWEPIIVAQKPKEGTYVENATKHGIAGFNIEDSRVQLSHDEEAYDINTWDEGAKPFGGGAGKDYSGRKEEKGRWPSNVLLDEEAAVILDEHTGDLGKSTGGRIGKKESSLVDVAPSGNYESGNPGFGDSGGASRFFYTAKANKKERELGLENFDEKEGSVYEGSRDGSLKTGSGNIRKKERKNHHPTVKPVELMRYLCRLTSTPEGGTVLDPFMGSGTTGIACVLEGRDFVGVELKEDYLKIADARINYAKQNPQEFN